MAVGVLRYRTVGGYSSHHSVRRIGLPMALGSIAGATLGSRLVWWVDARVLKAILAAVLAVSAIRMWRKLS